MNTLTFNPDTYNLSRLEEYQESQDHAKCDCCNTPLDDNGDCPKCFMEDL